MSSLGRLVHSIVVDIQPNAKVLKKKKKEREKVKLPFIKFCTFFKVTIYICGAYSNVFHIAQACFFSLVEIVILLFFLWTDLLQSIMFSFG